MGIHFIALTYILYAHTSKTSHAQNIVVGSLQPVIVKMFDILHVMKCSFVVAQ